MEMQERELPQDVHACWILHERKESGALHHEYPRKDLLENITAFAVLTEV